jgi:ParB/RepB/Spo0J family partition protein
MTPQSIPLPDIIRSKSNPRKTFDAAKLTELAASVKEHGVLQPILVRPNGKAGTYELVAGERRFRAAQEAGLTEIPALVRELTDTQVLEIQVIENLQRDDLHPLEEADGYRQLMAKKYDVARIAERIGRSVKYVYDRMKLAGLVDEARKIFLDGKITAGHAILLARLKPEDQKRCIGGDPNDRYMESIGGLFTRERTLFHPEKDRDEEPVKAVSVRELQGWIDRNVKLEADDVDQMILPETAAILDRAAEDDIKVLRLTHSDITPEAVREGPRVILGRSWKRADGQHKSKTCDWSRLGMIVIGAGRGDAFLVCVEKKKCATHWPDHVKAAKVAATAEKRAVAKGADPEIAREIARKAEQQRQQAEAERWNKAKPAVAEALAAAVKKAPAGAGTTLGEIVLAAFEDGLGYDYGSRRAAKVLPPGKTAEDLVRHLAWLALEIYIEDLEDQWSRDRLIPHAKALGVDVKKIVDQVAPAPKPEKAPAAKKPAKKGKK